MQEQADDIAVIGMVLKGQQAAYGILVARYQQYFFTLTMRYVNNRELAEELGADGAHQKRWNRVVKVYNTVEAHQKHK